MLNEIYNTEILQLSANILHIGLIDNANYYNKLSTKICGSNIEVSFNLNDFVIINYGQVIHACILGQASAAILAEAIIGTNIKDIFKIKDNLSAMLKNQTEIIQHKKFKKLELLKPARSLTQRHEAILLPFESICSAIKY